MTSSRGPDRRKFPRIPTDHVVSFGVLGGPDQIGQAQDLSSGGIRFRVVACEINLGEQLRLTFMVSNQQVGAVGTVVWATEIDPLTLEVGIQFDEIDARGQALLEAVASSMGSPEDA